MYEHKMLKVRNQILKFWYILLKLKIIEGLSLKIQIIHRNKQVKISTNRQKDIRLNKETNRKTDRQTTICAIFIHLK